MSEVLGVFYVQQCDEGEESNHVIVEQIGRDGRHEEPITFAVPRRLVKTFGQFTKGECVRLFVERLTP